MGINRRRKKGAGLGRWQPMVFGCCAGFSKKTINDGVVFKKIINGKKSFSRIRKNLFGQRDTRSVLEVGATPDDSCLLTMTSLKNVAEKVGINLDGPYTYKDFSIIKGNANAMSNFEEGRFNAVLCNSVFEHDKYFWKTLDEIKRVTKSGGLIVLGAPGYRVSKTERYFHGFLKRIRIFSRFFPANSTITLCMHYYPGEFIPV